MRRKKILSLIILFLGLYLIANLIGNAWRLFSAGGRVDQVRFETEALEVEVETLKTQRDFFASQEFVEQQARNELGLARPGETVVILPDTLPPVYDFAEEEKKAEVPVWRQWLQLFF